MRSQIDSRNGYSWPTSGRTRGVSCGRYTTGIVGISGGMQNGHQTAWAAGASGRRYRFTGKSVGREVSEESGCVCGRGFGARTAGESVGRYGTREET